MTTVTEGVLLSNIDIDPKDKNGVSTAAGIINAELTVKGYGKEAFIAVFDYAFGEFVCKTLALETQKGNVPFRALLESLGQKSTGSKKCKHQGKVKIPSVIYTVSKKKWEDERKKAAEKAAEEAEEKAENKPEDVQNFLLPRVFALI